MDGVINWLTGLLTDWVLDCLQFCSITGLLTAWLTDWLNDWLETDQLTIQPTGLLTEQKMNKWIDGLMDEQAGYLSIWETGLLTDLLTYWQTDYQ